MSQYSVVETFSNRIEENRERDGNTALAAHNICLSYVHTDLSYLGCRAGGPEETDGAYNGTDTVKSQLPLIDSNLVM